MSKFTNVSINVVITQKNIYDLDSFIDFLVKKEIKNVRFTPVFTNDENVRVNNYVAVSEFYKILNKIRNNNISILSDPVSHPWSLFEKENDIMKTYLMCPAQKTEFEIDIDGDVYPCPFLYNQKYKMGNILLDDFYDIWNNKIPELKKVKWSNNEKCMNCKSYEFCGGSCYAMAEISNVDYDERCEL